MRRVDLAALGLSDGGLRKRRARGWLHRKYAGVYAVGHPKLSQEGEWMAGVLAAGEGAVLGVRSAASHWEIWDGPTRITEVLAPRGRRPKGPVLVRTYRRLDPADVTVHKGIPVTTVARTLVDLTEVFDAHQLAQRDRRRRRGRLLLPERRLVVEIDDPSHGRERSQREDALERRVLEAAGYTLLRFTNAEVEQRPVLVLSRLRAGSR